MVSAGAYFLESMWQFYLIAVVIGIVQGGIQALSRSYYARLVTAEESAQFFGFFNMMGRFASILGPFLYGTVALVSGNPRAGLIVPVCFFVIGAVMLRLSERAGGARA